MINTILNLIFGNKKPSSSANSQSSQSQSTATPHPVTTKPEPTAEELEEERVKEMLRSMYKELNAKDEEMASKDTGNFDKSSLHGNHYTIEEFEKWADKRYTYLIEDNKNDGREITAEDEERLQDSSKTETFTKWNPSISNDLNRQAGFSQKLYNKRTLGVESIADAKADVTNPLYAPINGMSIEDYGAVNARMAGGYSFEDIAAAMGMEVPVFSDAINQWSTRITQDVNAGIYMSNGYTGVDSHPKLGNIKKEVSAEAQATISKLEADINFCEEVRAAQTAASEAGLDCNKYLVDKYGITTGELMKIYANQMQPYEFDTEFKLKMSRYFDTKLEEFRKQFAAEAGGGAADDIKF